MSPFEPVLTIRFSNAAASDLMVWVEPWCHEWFLSPRSELALLIDGAAPDLESADGRVVVWAAGGSRIQVLVDGVSQHAGSAEIAAPDLPGLSSREFLSITLSHVPEARLGGTPFPPSPSRRSLFAGLFGRRI